MGESVVSSLGLRIYGGPLALGLNRTPLVAVGAAPDRFRPAPPTIVDEDLSWMLVHAQEYTLYAQHSRDILTAEGEPAQLLICLFMPVESRLAGNKSPLALLTSLHDNFAVIGAPDGKLPVEELDNSPFRMILGRYQLEARPLQLPVMSGAEPASLRAASHSQLDALMRHSRYSSLLRIGRLEIGFHCPSTVALTDDVPEPEPEPAPKPEPPPLKDPHVGLRPPQDDNEASAPQDDNEVSAPIPRPSVSEVPNAVATVFLVSISVIGTILLLFILSHI